MKKGFSSVSFASFFPKKLVRSIYNVTMTRIFFIWICSYSVTIFLF